MYPHHPDDIAPTPAPDEDQEAFEEACEAEAKGLLRPPAVTGAVVCLVLSFVLVALPWWVDLNGHRVHSRHDRLGRYLLAVIFVTRMYLGTQWTRWVLFLFVALQWYLVWGWAAGVAEMERLEVARTAAILGLQTLAAVLLLRRSSRRWFAQPGLPAGATNGEPLRGLRGPLG